MADLPGGATAPKIMVMGLGGFGALVADEMRHRNPLLEAVAVDTDAKALEALEISQKICLGSSVTNGFGAGGSAELGRQAIEKDATAVRRSLRDVGLVVLVAGLGKGTGSGAMPVVARLARGAGAAVTCLVATPFGFEGEAAAKIAEEAIRKIRAHADAIVRVSNEAVVDKEHFDLPAKAAFARSRQVVSDGVFSIWKVLAQNGILGLDFSALRVLLRQCDGFCRLAQSEAAGVHRDREVAEALTNHPLLNKGRALSGAAGVVAAFVGGPDLRLEEIEQVMEAVRAKLPEEARINFGVAIDPAMVNRMGATLLVAEAWKEPLVDASGTSPNELPLDFVGKGAFEGAEATVYNGENLDRPAYVRRGIALPR